MTFRFLTNSSKKKKTEKRDDVNNLSVTVCVFDIMFHVVVVFFFWLNLNIHYIWKCRNKKPGEGGKVR